MIEKYKEVNKYFTVIVLGIITFLNSDLYFSNVVSEGNQDMIDGINSITKFLLIVAVLFLLTQIPLNKIHKLLITIFSWFGIKLYQKIKKKKISINYDKVFGYLVSTLSNFGYVILFCGFIFFIVLM